ncbi:MAG: ABC transporter substrate-binding protein [Thermomicrobiales bacterium]
MTAFDLPAASPVRMLQARTDRRSLIGSTALAGAAAVLAGSALSPLAAAQDSSGTLIVDLGSEPENLDIQQGLAATTSLLTTQIFESLLRVKPGTLDVEPWLAESYESSEDGLTWTFKLRQGVTFHDGTPFDADAVKFNYDRQFDETNEYYKLGQWSNGGYFDFIKTVTVKDPATVEIALSSTFNKFEYRMTGFSIVSPTAVEKYKETFPENPVGTGPYAFQQWDKGQQVVLAPNESYWGVAPTLDQVVFKAIAEAGARAAALLSGETMIAVEITPEIMQQLATNDAFEIVTGPTGALWFLAMNVENEHFKDVRVRQAANFAVDKETLVSAVLNGTADIAQGPLSPAFTDYNPAVEGLFSYDPDKAKALLAEAGWDSSTEVTFYCSIGGSGMLSPEEMATVIQDNLRAVGLNAKIVTQDFVTWMDTIRDPQNDLTVMSWNIAPVEPDAMFNGILSKASLPPGFNTSYWVNDEVEQLLPVGRTSIDADEAKQAYFRIQEIVMEEVPIIPVCHRQQLFGVSKYVQNFAAVPSMDLILEGVTVSS